MSPTAIRSKFAPRIVLPWLGTVALLLSAAPTAGQYIYVANAGEATISEIDINTDKEVARFRTWFDGGNGNAGPRPFPQRGPSPSRIAVNSDIYVLNRMFDFPDSNGVTKQRLPVLFKIRPPSPAVSTTSHVTGSGLLTGLGATEVLPLTDLNNDDVVDKTTNPNTNEVKDERIVWVEQIGIPGSIANGGDDGALGRALCIDLQGYLWVGMNLTHRYYKVDPTNGQEMLSVSTIQDGTNHTPYGCAVDAKGILWSVSSSTKVPGVTLAAIDTQAGTLLNPGIWNHTTPINYGNDYALSLQRGCGVPRRIYLSEWTLGKTYISFDPTTNTFANPPNSLPPGDFFSSITIGVDLQGNIVSGNFDYTGIPGQGNAFVVKTTPAGAEVWNTQQSGTTKAGNDLHGIIIDAHNDVWAVLREPTAASGGSVVKYDGVTGAQMAIVSLGLEPYTYSNVQAPNCPCLKAEDARLECRDQSGTSTSYSFTLNFTNQSPFSTPVTDAALSSTDVTGLTPTSVHFSPPIAAGGQGAIAGAFTVANGQPGDSVCLQVQLLGGERSWCCPKEPVCFRLPKCRQCVQVAAKVKCRPNGTRYLELTVTNGGPSTSGSLQVFSTTPGVTITPSMMPLSLASGNSATVQLGLSGASLGQAIDLTVSLHGPLNQQTGAFDWCCSAMVHFTYPTTACFVTVGGEVFDDSDSNRQRDLEEAGIEGWTVVLATGEGLPPHTTVTDAHGAYRFENLQPGSYSLSVRPPAGRRATTQPEEYELKLTTPIEQRYDFAVVRNKQ